MLWFDYLLILMPAVALTIWAQVRIVRARAAASRIPAGSGLDGAEVARLIMSDGGIQGLAIEPASGELSDYYDPRGRVLRLSRDVREGRSLAATGAVAHEAGHAIQDAAGYPGLFLRNLIAPTANLGSQVFWMLIAAGVVLGMFRLIVLAIWLFWGLVLVQLANVPIERDASRRAREALRSAGLMGAEEEPAVSSVLDTVAWTHVAAMLTGVRTLRPDFSRSRHRPARS